MPLCFRLSISVFHSFILLYLPAMFSYKYLFSLVPLSFLVSCDPLFNLCFWITFCSSCLTFFSSHPYISLFFVGYVLHSFISFHYTTVVVRVVFAVVFFFNTKLFFLTFLISYIFPPFLWPFSRLFCSILVRLSDSLCLCAVVNTFLFLLYNCFFFFLLFLLVTFYLTLFWCHSLVSVSVFIRNLRLVSLVFVRSTLHNFFRSSYFATQFLFLFDISSSVFISQSVGFVLLFCLCLFALVSIVWCFLCNSSQFFFFFL